MARLASEFVEVFGEPSISYARLASEFVEVFGVPATTPTPTISGVWPQEQLGRAIYAQGQRLKKHSGQM